MTLDSTTLRNQPPYVWPDPTFDRQHHDAAFGGLFRTMPLHETRASVAGDSRWPAFFPSPIGLLTTGAGADAVIERVVGPMIVNRFPLVMAISLCREPLSDRHYARRTTMQVLEATGAAVVQFVAPGPALSRALEAIAAEPDARAAARLGRMGATTFQTTVTATRTLGDAYLAYEGRLARPGTSLDGTPIYDKPWVDIGSHRVYFLEVLAIHLRTTIARAERQIAWHSLPIWAPAEQVEDPPYDGSRIAGQQYVKTYTPDYRFPASGTVAFDADEISGDMSIRHLEPLASGQVVVDNDRARWPCFFPSSAGMLTAWRQDGRPTVMPCGSTAVVSRLPLTIAAAISNSAINERYAPRATLNTIRASGRFGVGVPFTDATVIRAISYLGNISASVDPDKVRHAGLSTLPSEPAPVIAQLPIHFDCRVTGEMTLGTHVLVLGEVERIYVRRDATAERPLEWQPWAAVV
jgi:flavin reductase (DIM6/NTAB) family NADH-FMN oxidoreductase RutF